MVPGGDAGRVVETVALFKTADTLQDAIDDLLSSGFDRADLSLLASEKEVEKKLGHSYQTVAELEDDATVPRSCYVAPEAIGDAEGALVGGLLYVGAVAGATLASGGTLAATIKGAALTGGAGALIGSVFAMLVGHHHSHHLREQLGHGGLLLWVRTRDLWHIKHAVEILFRHSGRDVHVHACPTNSSGSRSGE